MRIALLENGPSLRLVVEDNGRGLSHPEHRTSSLGMTGMRARARQSGGELHVENVRPHGVRISVTMPVRKPPDSNEERSNPAFPLVQ